MHSVCFSCEIFFYKELHLSVNWTENQTRNTKAPKWKIQIIKENDAVCGKLSVSVKNRF